MKSEAGKAEPAPQPAAGDAPPRPLPVRRPARPQPLRAAPPMQRGAELVQLEGRPARTPPFVVELPAPPARIIEQDDIQLPARPAPVRRPAQRLKPRRRWGAFFAFLLMVMVPAAVAFVYFGWYAANQYVATAKFAIRTQMSSGDTGLSRGGGASLISFGNYGVPSIADTFIVTEYIHSGQMLEDIENKVDLRKIYSYPGADWYYRLDATVSDEQLLEYWNSVASIEYDVTTGVSTLTVRAFTPEDAKAVGEAVLAAGEKLVNEISDRAQGDALSLAQAEVDNGKKRMNEALEALAEYQKAQKQISATALAESREKIEAQLESDKAKLEAQLLSLRDSLSEEAPAIKLIKSQIASLESQLKVERSRSATSTSDDPAVSAVMLDFDKLSVEREFAAKAYTNALATLEGARQEAMKQTRYLVAFVRPQLPDDTLFPNRPYTIGLVFAVAAMAWLFTMLVGAVIREHV